jgi:HD-GYP domain-containing protein (c-di-GMP phosphodiesterase class II)
MGTMAAEKDGYTQEHQEEVANFTLELARELGLPNAEDVAFASRLHDTGKIGISDNILKGANKLDKAEQEKMREHPSIGAKILEHFKEFGEEFRLAYEIALKHHERRDGKGYPEQLQGEAIPLHVSVVSAADVFSAMINKRSYKEPMPLFKVLETFLNTTNPKNHLDGVGEQVTLALLNKLTPKGYFVQRANQYLDGSPNLQEQNKQVAKFVQSQLKARGENISDRKFLESLYENLKSELGELYAE